MSLFITFEGVEGSGKSTQIEMLHNTFVDMRLSVVKTREPGGTAVGDRLRSLLLEPSSTPFSAQTELLLYMAARAQLAKEVIAPALKSGTFVISDRYMDSSVAYQGYGRGVDLRFVKHLNKSVSNGSIPDFTVLLDLDPEIGLARISSRPLGIFRSGLSGLDRVESESLQFHRRVRKGYLILAKENPERFVVVNGRESKELIHKQIVHELMRRHGGRFPANGSVNPNSSERSA